MGDLCDRIELEGDFKPHDFSYGPTYEMEIILPIVGNGFLSAMVREGKIDPEDLGDYEGPAEYSITLSDFEVYSSKPERSVGWPGENIIEGFQFLIEGLYPQKESDKKLLYKCIENHITHEITEDIVCIINDFYEPY